MIIETKPYIIIPKDPKVSYVVFDFRNLAKGAELRKKEEQEIFNYVVEKYIFIIEKSDLVPESLRKGPEITWQEVEEALKTCKIEDLPYYKQTEEVVSKIKGKAKQEQFIKNINHKFKLIQYCIACGKLSFIEQNENKEKEYIDIDSHIPSCTGDQTIRFRVVDANQDIQDITFINPRNNKPEQIMKGKKEIVLEDMGIGKIKIHEQVPEM